MLVRVMVVNNHNFLVDFDNTVVNLADTDTANIIIVIDCADKYLQRSLRVSFRSRDIFYYSFKKRNHVIRFIFYFIFGISASCRSKYKRAVKLLVIGIKFK